MLLLLILRLILQTDSLTTLDMILTLVLNSRAFGRWLWQWKEKATILSGAEFYMEAYSFRNSKNAAHSEHHCILLLSEEKNSFHLEFLFHHKKFFKLISGRETLGCRLHSSSWCPLFPAVRKFYCIIAPFFVAYSSFKVLFLLASVQPKIGVLLFLKRRITTDLRDCLCQKSLEYQFVEVLLAQVFFSFFHPSFRNYFLYNINF